MFQVIQVATILCILTSLVSGEKACSAIDSTNMEIAWKFFDAVEKGKGWEAVQSLCASKTYFIAQTDILKDVKDIETYANWMKDLGLESATYKVISSAYDDSTSTAIFEAIFYPFGPKEDARDGADYVYAIHFDADGQIDGMKKVWNDGYTFEHIMGVSGSPNMDTAQLFFDACESGKGWEAVQSLCASKTSFIAQTMSLGHIKNLQEYTTFMKNLTMMYESATYEITSSAYDDSTSTAMFDGIFYPLGKEDGRGSHYVYMIHLDTDGKIDWMKKVWNDAYVKILFSDEATG